MPRPNHGMCCLLPSPSVATSCSPSPPCVYIGLLPAVFDRPRRGSRVESRLGVTVEPPISTENTVDRTLMWRRRRRTAGLRSSSAYNHETHSVLIATRCNGARANTTRRSSLAHCYGRTEAQKRSSSSKRVLVVVVLSVGAGSGACCWCLPLA